MLDYWSSGYLLLLLIIGVVFYAAKKRHKAAWVALPLLVALWVPWEYMRPFWITGSVSTETNPDGLADVYVTNDAWSEQFENHDMIVPWLKANSRELGGVVADMKQKQIEGTAMATGWRNFWIGDGLMPDLITIDKAEDFNPWLSWRVLMFYIITLVLWALILFNFGRWASRTEKKAA